MWPRPYFGEGCDHSVEIDLAAEFGVQRPMVDNVVAVGAARPRLHIGRGVDVADPQPCEIRGKPRRIRKAKPLVKLKTVGDARNHLLLWGPVAASEVRTAPQLIRERQHPSFLLIGRPLTHQVLDFSSEPGLLRQSTCEPLTHRSRRSSGEFPTWTSGTGRDFLDLPQDRPSVRPVGAATPSLIPPTAEAVRKLIELFSPIALWSPGPRSTGKMNRQRNGS